MSLARTLAVVAFALLAPTARAEKAAEDVQDLIVFHDARPLFIRLHIVVDGQPYRAHWAATIAKLHRYLDADGDGVFSADERVKWLKQFGGIMQMNRSKTPGGPNARMISEVSTAADLAEYLRASFGPFQLQVVPANADANDPLFSRLDLDGNGLLSRSELGAAESTLMKFDEDDDETVRADELNPYRNPFTGRRRVVNRPDPSTPAPEPLFVAIGADEPLAKLARRLLAKYDKKGTPDDGPGPDNRLQPDEVGLDPASFAGVDQDGDGGLDFDEVTRALADPQFALELRVSVGRKGAAVEVVAPAFRPPGSTIRKGTGGEMVLNLNPDLIEIHAPAGGGVDLRDFYRQQFRAADGDNNKYLEAKETQGNGVFNNVFALMDRDGDGKVFENEMDDFVGHQVDAAESRTVLSVADRGHTLFPRLDQNGDGRLSARELREAVKKLSLCDRDGDGDVAEGEIPRHYRLDFVPGQSPALIQFGGPRGSTVMTGTTSTTVGPDWFLRMDLNRDGDVSPREFLGTRDQFRRVDADGDGLIDAREAARGR